MKLKKVLAILLMGVMVVSMLGGCNKSTDNNVNTSVQDEGKKDADTKSTVEDSNSVVDLEMWNVNGGFLPVEKGGVTYNFYKDLLGVGIVQPYVEWNGGTTYQQQLNLKIAAGEMPDIFLPVNGMESSLIESGALLDLTDLLPEKAPHLWKLIPQEVWDVMRTYDPSGKGRIYTIPNVRDYTLMSGLIRQDWLDKLGLSMPTTQDEFVKVLEAFKTQDPNGNGVADEIPTGGRQEAKWMDQLFGMYGLAMWEGAPQWDIYDGKLTYAAVTPNMKDALAFISDLYKKGLMDPETLLNDGSAWQGKIFANQVGVAYHWSESAYQWAEATKAATGVEPDWAVLPAISAPGYQAFYTTKKVNGVSYVVKATDDEAKIDAVMKVLDAYGNVDLWDKLWTGVEGMHAKMVDGNLTKLPEDKATQENQIVVPSNDIALADYKIKLFQKMSTPDRKWAFDQAIRNIKDNQQYGKEIAGDGIPSNIYDGYPDIMNRTLYIEYASKIIVGEYSIDKFDEFVDKWNASGGETVTKAAREWYAKKSK
ncbi:ABC transporter substrate-binding protein [Anaerocolumna jejuensis]|uniref:ABC transporter substrate-binding protein n=1 Tax=Anaerocolumna jejuensis TaxID=259063 RepID=UPI003F7B9F50